MTAHARIITTLPRLTLLDTCLFFAWLPSAHSRVLLRSIGNTLGRLYGMRRCRSAQLNSTLFVGALVGGVLSGCSSCCGPSSNGANHVSEMLPIVVRR